MRTRLSRVRTTSAVVNSPSASMMVSARANAGTKLIEKSRTPTPAARKCMVASVCARIEGSPYQFKLACTRTQEVDFNPVIMLAACAPLTPVLPNTRAHGSFVRMRG